MGGSGTPSWPYREVVLVGESRSIATGRTLHVRRPKPLQIFTAMRYERTLAGVRLCDLAIESDIPASTLSLVERNLAILPPDRERSRVLALRRLAAQHESCAKGIS
jgi:hypothetical protein